MYAHKTTDGKYLKWNTDPTKAKNVELVTDLNQATLTEAHSSTRTAMLGLHLPLQYE